MRRAPAILLLLACAHAPPQPWRGLTRQQAVEVCLPPGEQAYLSSLQCPDGAAAQAHRIGSVGSRNQTTSDDPRLLQQMDPGEPLKPGELDLHIVDAFEVQCPTELKTVYLDMYHCR